MLMQKGDMYALMAAKRNTLKGCYGIVPCKSEIALLLGSP